MGSQIDPVILIIEKKLNVIPLEYSSFHR